MIATFHSIMPVFLLIVAGNLLRRRGVVPKEGWEGLERLGYWFLYPSLLFVTILEADFHDLEIDHMMGVLLASLAFMVGLTLFLGAILSRKEIIANAEFSSIFQTTIRWNGFVALAIAQGTFPPEGMAVVALAMAVIIIPINIVSVFVVARFAERAMNWRRVLVALATNPLILPCLAAVAFRSLSLQPFEALIRTMHLSGDAALALALLMVGAALRVRDVFQVRAALALPVVLKLIMFPGVLLAIGTSAGVSGKELVYLTLCAAVPTATNGYLLAKQHGGDAELYAAVTTAQTALSFATLPLMLWIAAQLAGG